nr:hypothetical protein GCM10020185_29730 [Pseudomonas brassicacearum subsp. brassicacearum]
MLRMRFNLYAGGSNKADLESKSYLSNQALDIRNNALRQLNEELGLAWNALNNANAQVPVAQQYVDRSANVRTAYQKQFSLGERTLLDLLDSEKRAVQRFPSPGGNQECAAVHPVPDQGNHGPAVEKARVWSRRWHRLCRTT